ncbi:MAG: deoxyribose-phosphate aldolase [Candidatus Nealsonbacteria bacterium]|nr:deoxyribose-phosphate aldolase [Candidatus Nealsonbacteria bacterium]
MKNINQIAKIIDQTNIDLKATIEDIKKTCQEAKEYGFRGVCINPKWTKLAKKELKGSNTKVIILIDPPMGQSTTLQRVRACKKAKKDGADETDVVMNIIDLKYERYGKVLKDLKTICKILPTKVIIGSGFLTDGEIEKASTLVKEAGAICVKTATSKDPLESREMEEKAKHVAIMKKSAPGLLIKASGRVSNLEDLKKMVEAGADLIGTSYGVQIIKETFNQK